MGDGRQRRGGGYFGAKLQQAGHAVVFVARGETLRVLQTDGLTLQSEGAETHLSPVVATDGLVRKGNLSSSTM